MTADRRPSSLVQPSGPFEWTQAAAGLALRCAPLQEIADHLFTTRRWRLGAPVVASEDEAWSDVATAMRVDPSRLARLRQVHGATVVMAESASCGTRPDADILISRDRSIAVAVQVADCVPLLAADRRSGAVGAAHAGWRGLAARVPHTLVSAMTREFGTSAADLVIAVGPSIGACCYEVGTEVRDAFRHAFTGRLVTRWFLDDPRPTTINPSIEKATGARRGNHWFFDTWTAVRDQLEEAGVPAANIHRVDLCTASHADLLCSYRRDGQAAGRMAAAIRSAAVTGAF
jgi:YfiH family protein